MRFEISAFIQPHLEIDYLDAEKPTASLMGRRVYLAEGDGQPAEVPQTAPERARRPLASATLYHFELAPCA